MTMKSVAKRAMPVVSSKARTKPCAFAGSEPQPDNYANETNGMWLRSERTITSLTMFALLPPGLTWKDFGKRLSAQFVRNDVMASAAQLSFYFVLALSPFLLFLTSLLGYFAEAGTELRANMLRYLGSIMPAKAHELIYEIVD